MYMYLCPDTVLLLNMTEIERLVLKSPFSTIGLFILVKVPAMSWFLKNQQSHAPKIIEMQ